MIAWAYDYAQSDEFVVFERKWRLCPIRSWALYYACETHLASDTWDTRDSKMKREYVFTQAFSEGHYKDWTVPVLLQIIRNDLWKERYPHYFEEIANRVFVGTSQPGIVRVFRTLSVFAGRYEVKPFPALVGAAIILLAVASWNKEAAPTTFSYYEVLEGGITEVLESHRGLRVADNDVAAVRTEIERAIEEISHSGFNPIDGAIKVAAEADPTPFWARLALAPNGNEQGVGPGIIVA